MFKTFVTGSVHIQSLILQNLLLLISILLLACSSLEGETHAQNQLETLSQLGLKVHYSQCWKSKQ